MSAETPHPQAIGAAADVATENGAAPPPGAVLHSVTIDGEERQVSLEDALAAYQLAEDLRLREQKLSSEREQLAATRRDILTEQLRLAEAARARLQADVEADEAFDWPRLAREQPEHFRARQAEALRRRELLSGLQGELAELSRHAGQARRAEEDAKLLAQRPELKDPAVLAAFRREAAALLAEYGYAAGEIDAVADHRDLAVLHDALAWRKLQSERRKLNGQRQAPAEGAGLKPAAQRGEAAGGREFERQRRRALSGSLRDQADFILRRLAAPEA